MTLASLYDCAKNAHHLYSKRRAGKVYPHEIGIQKTRTKHRKLDSQATLSHRARNRAADGLRPQAWPLRAPRRDLVLVAYCHGLRASEVCELQWQQIELSEGRLHVRRVKNGIPSVHPIRGDEMRALRKLRREYSKDAYVFVSERGSRRSLRSARISSPRIGCTLGNPVFDAVHMQAALG